MRHLRACVHVCTCTSNLCVCARLRGPICTIKYTHSHLAFFGTVGSSLASCAHERLLQHLVATFAQRPAHCFGAGLKPNALK